MNRNLHINLALRFGLRSGPHNSHVKQRTLLDTLDNNLFCTIFCEVACLERQNLLFIQSIIGHILMINKANEAELQPKSISSLSLVANS